MDIFRIALIPHALRLKAYSQAERRHAGKHMNSFRIALMPYVLRLKAYPQAERLHRCISGAGGETSGAGTGHHPSLTTPVNRNRSRNLKGEVKEGFEQEVAMADNTPVNTGDKNRSNISSDTGETVTSGIDSKKSEQSVVRKRRGRPPKESKSQTRQNKKETLRDNIKQYIQSRIIDGTYKPGDRIVETRLAKELNVSQAPVREAMLELSLMGLLEEKPYSGTFISEMSIFDIQDVFECRAMIEKEAVSRAAKLATDEQILHLDDIIDQMERSDDPEEVTRLDLEIHESIMEAACSPTLHRMWSLLRLNEWTYISMSTTELPLDAISQQHRYIMEAIRQRDSSSAAAVMFLHIKYFGNEVSDFFRREHSAKAGDVPDAAGGRERLSGQSADRRLSSSEGGSSANNSGAGSSDAGSSGAGSSDVGSSDARNSGSRKKVPFPKF